MSYNHKCKDYYIVVSFTIMSLMMSDEFTIKHDTTRHYMT